MLWLLFKPGWLVEQINQSNFSRKQNLSQIKKIEYVYQSLVHLSDLVHDYHLNIRAEDIVQLEKELIAYKAFNDNLMKQLKTSPTLGDLSKDAYYLLQYFSYLRDDCIRWFDPYLKEIITINIKYQHVQIALPFKINASDSELQWLLGVYNQTDCIRYILKRTTLSQIMYSVTHFVKEIDLLVTEFFKFHTHIIHNLQTMKTRLWFFQTERGQLLDRLIALIEYDLKICITSYQTQLNLMQIDWFSFAYLIEYQLHIQNTWHHLQIDAQQWIRDNIVVLLKHSFANPYTLSYLDLIMLNSSMDWFEYQHLKEKIIYLINSQKEMNNILIVIKEINLDFIDDNTALYLTNEKVYSEKELIFIQKLVCILFWHDLKLGPWSQNFDQEHLYDLWHRVQHYKRNTNKNWLLQNILGSWVLSSSNQGEFTDSEIINQIYFPKKSQPTLLWLWLYQIFNPSMRYWIQQMISFSAHHYFDRRFLIDTLDIISDRHLSKLVIHYCFERLLWIDWLRIFYEGNACLIDQLVVEIMNYLIKDEHFTLECVVLDMPLFKQIMERISPRLSYQFNGVKAYSKEKIAVMFDIFCNQLRCVPIDFRTFVFNQYVIYQLSSLKIFDFLDQFYIWYTNDQLLIEHHCLEIIQKKKSESVQFAFEHAQIVPWLVVWFDVYRDLEWDPIFETILYRLYKHRFDIEHWIACLPFKISEIAHKTHSVIILNPLVYYMFFYQLFPQKTYSMLLKLYGRYKFRFLVSEYSKVIDSILSKDKSKVVMWNNLSFFKNQEDEVCSVVKNINQV